MATLTIENVIEAAKLSLDFTIQRIDDWKNVVPEGKALRKECEQFQSIIGHVVNKPHLPISGILQDVNYTMNKTNNMIETFLNDDARDRSIFSKVGWKMQRPWLAYNNRATFKATTEHLEASKKKIQETLHDSSQINRPTAHWYRGDMINEESFTFWTDICGEEVQASSWSIFTDTYQQRYNVHWDDDIIERICRVACRDGTHFTISGYINLTNLCGFPLDVDNLPFLTETHPAVSSQIRLEVVRMINELVIYYSTKEMRDLLVAIFMWYEGCNKRDKEAWQERANDWARVVRANRGRSIDEMNERDKLAEKVDMARRTYMFFFQRYMAVLKFGPFSKDMFAEVDFPGKARIYEFIEYVGPLDYANFHIVIRGRPDDWESRQPKVYKFLKDLIASERRAKEEARIKAKMKAEKAAKALDQRIHEEAIRNLAIVNNGPLQDNDSLQGSKARLII